jgi:tryptophan 2,3-dioxygenase
MELSPEVQQRLMLLKEKYDAQGQDLLPYLDGLLYAKTVNYWDYIQVDTLLSLQKTSTDFPDETIFVVYHQITELYFKLALHEFEQLGEQAEMTAAFFISRVKRINRYFEALTKSFEIMIDGMEREQFLKFRMTLHPASGFQSAQYRKIEICSTDFLQLMHKDVRDSLSGSEPCEALFESIYWKEGATDATTGKKTLALEDFEHRYKAEFIELAEDQRTRNLWQCYLRLSPEEQNQLEVIQVMKQNDVNVNVNWPLMHYKSAVKYLQQNQRDIPATGGTNWQKYLPPRFQKRIFYPLLWSEEEVEQWGKSWVESVLA